MPAGLPLAYDLPNKPCSCNRQRGAPAAQVLSHLTTISLARGVAESMRTVDPYGGHISPPSSPPLVAGAVWVIKKESQHLRTRVRAVVVRVGALRAPARPGMRAAVHDPVLCDDSTIRRAVHAPG